MVVDAVLGAAVAVVVAVAIAANLGGQRSPEPLAYLFALGLGLLMLVRRRYPVLALVATSVGLLAYYVGDYPPVGLALPVAAALYSAAEQDRLRWAVGMSVALLAISTFFRVREGDDLGYLLGYELATTVAVMAAAVALGDGVRARRMYRAEQRRREALMLAEREHEAAERVEQERLRIARDLHDVLAHTVAVVSIQSDVATEALDDEDDEATRAALATIRSASSEATRELRSTLAVLRRPAEGEPVLPTGSLRHLDTVVSATTESGLPVDLRVEGEPEPLPAVVDTTAYRIVQESLTNALRHADADRVELVLRYSADRLEIQVTDDGHGGDAGTGRGVTGMRERAELVGGTVAAGSHPGGGFRVSAVLPVAVHR
ncbi:MAG: sensor histidine kinase [Streptosporangiales bacterium]|nr:sensor histidine kinase [Streptosporangiales bacterium]